MAITIIEYTLISEAKNSGLFPDKPKILELGEANWYKDIPIDTLAADIVRHIPNPAEQEQLLKILQELDQQPGDAPLFGIAKIFWKTFLDYETLDAIDPSGTPKAHKLDLNYPVDTGGSQFDVVTNLGTAEHVFNVYQFFKSVHELTKPGGLMIHGMPFNGWFDHGFYNFQPTFYYDLAAANGYEIHGVYYTILKPFEMFNLESREHVAQLAQQGKIGENVLLYAIFQKPSGEEKPFAVPHQGYYAKALSDEANKAWQALR